MELSWSLITLTILASFFSSHPLTLCLGLICFSLGLSPLISLLLSKWVAYAIILIFLGGMMVLFIYVSTLAGNEKLVFFSFTKIWPFPLILMFWGGTYLPSTEPSNLMITHLYTNFSVALLLFLTLYLLCTLIVVIFLSQGFKGALMSYS